MYYFLFLFAILIYFINGTKNLNIGLSGVLSIILIVLSGLRYNVGPDYINYEYIYNTLNTFDLEKGQEPGFQLLILSCKSIGLDYTGFNFVTSFLIIGFLMFSNYSKFKKEIIILYFCFFYLVWCMSGVRQGIALSLAFLLYSYDIKNKIFYFIAPLIVSSFHASALLLFLFPLVNILSIPKLYLTVTASILFSFISLENIILKIFPEDYSGAYSISRLLFYQDNYTSDAIKILDFQSLSRILILLWVISLYELNKKFTKQIHYQKEYKIFISSFSVYFIFKFSEVTASNLSMYGFIYLVLLLPSFGSSILGAKKYIFNFSLIVFSILFFLKGLHYMWHASKDNFDNIDFYIPYTNILGI
uniref:EpsG family protein n=1 Tax=Flavobacterium sp. TaxID=239 RepID=UPI00404ACA81